MAESVLALIAALGGISILLQLELSALLTPLATFVIPPAILMLWVFRKGVARDRAVEPPLSRILGLTIVVGWVLSLVPGLFWGAIFLYIYEPWPLSLQQGPDTAAANEGFRLAMGWTPDEVTGVYYKGYNIRDQDIYLRFDSCDPEIEATVVEGLEAQRNEAPSISHLNDRLTWWFVADAAAGFDRFTADLREVWIDRSSCTFYIRSWTF